MPYVLQHKETKQIYTAMLVNHYELAYYGVKFWAEAQEAERDAAAFLQAKGVVDASSWELLHLDEREMKLCNVKLRNDPRLSLYWQVDRKPEVH
ncbi:hypothetical protein [Paenibacillus ferrarius]|uniref:hypothetical protein n=1 Tax=Paenibacillus ferrarius TaxID=1469647 RepID=UPI003D28F99F